MSESNNGRRDRPGDGDSGPTERSGISPLDISLRDLKRFRSRSPDETDAGDVHDPHTWDDPDPGIVSRLTPDSIIGWIATVAGGLITVALLAYLVPVFWPIITNPFVVFGVLFAVYSAGIWLHGRQSGWDAYRRLTKSIIYFGDDMKARVGYQPEDVPDDVDREFFTPYRSMRFGGFRPRSLLKRDLPFDPSRLRAKSPWVTGDDPVIDRLNATTIKLDTSVLGTVLFTHGAALKYEDNAGAADRFVSLPETIDEGAVDDLHRMITALETELDQQQMRIDLLHHSNRELRDLRSAQQLPDMEQAVEILDRIGDKVITDRSRTTRDGSDTLRRIQMAADGPAPRRGDRQ